VKLCSTFYAFFPSASNLLRLLALCPIHRRQACETGDLRCHAGARLQKCREADWRQRGTHEARAQLCVGNVVVVLSTKSERHRRTGWIASLVVHRRSKQRQRGTREGSGQFRFAVVIIITRGWCCCIISRNVSIEIRDVNLVEGANFDLRVRLAKTPIGVPMRD